MYPFLNTVNLLLFGILAGILLCARGNEVRIRVDLEKLFVALICSTCFISVTGLVLLELSVFSHRLLQQVVFAANIVLSSILLWMGFTKRFYISLPSVALRFHHLALFLLLAMAFALRIPASRYFYGGQDQGSYMITAELMARKGSISYRDEMVSRTWSDPRLASLKRSFSTFSKDSNLAQSGRYEGAIYPGYYVADMKKGKVVPQFFHLHPMWMALCSRLLGRWNGVSSLLFFSMMSLIAAYLIASRVFEDRTSGFLALILLSLNILEVWTSRYPLSEIPSQSLMLCGLYLYGRALEGGSGSRAVAALGGVTLGLTLMTRISAVVIVCVISLFYLIERPATRGADRDRWISRSFHLAAFATFLWSGAHVVAFSYPYLFDLIRFQTGIIPLFTAKKVLIWGAVFLVLYVAFKELVLDLLLGRAVDRIVSLASRHNMKMALASGAAVLALLFYTAAFPPPLPGEQPHGWISRIVQLVGFISWPGLVAGVLGTGFLMTLKEGRGLGLLLAALGFASTVFVLLLHPYNGYAYYYCRYYVSELLPLLLLGTALLSGRMMRSSFGLFRGYLTGGDMTSTRSPVPRSPVPRSPVPRSPVLFRPAWTMAKGVLAALLVVYLVFLFGRGYFTNKTYRVQEAYGSHHAVETVASRLPANAVVLVGGRDQHALTYELGTPLHLAYGRRTLQVMSMGGIPREVFLLSGPVYLVESGRAVRPGKPENGLLFELVGEGVLPYLHSEQSLLPPVKLVHGELRYFIYRVSKKESDEKEGGTRSRSHR